MLKMKIMAKVAVRGKRLVSHHKPYNMRINPLTWQRKMTLLQSVKLTEVKSLHTLLSMNEHTGRITTLPAFLLIWCLWQNIIFFSHLVFPLVCVFCKRPKNNIFCQSAQVYVHVCCCKTSSLYIYSQIEDNDFQQNRLSKQCISISSLFCHESIETLR